MSGPRLSARAHLALGLAALAASVVFAATLLGLVPDAEAEARQHRAAVAEAMAIVVSSYMDKIQSDASAHSATTAMRPGWGWLEGGASSDAQANASVDGLPDILQAWKQRDPALLSIGVRDAGGELRVDIEAHGKYWRAGPRNVSTDSELFVPVWRGGQAWGEVELRFKPLRANGWRGALQDPSLLLAGFVFLASLPMFALYLRRMLRELDPTRAVPARVRTAYDTLTEGLLVLDDRGRIVLANTSTASMLGVDETALIGGSPSRFAWEDGDGVLLPRGELPWEQALASRERHRDVALRVRSTKGTAYALRANCSPIVGERGALQALVVSFQDVTELEQRGQALREAKEQADAANEAKSRFLANMSHEIRTPMNAILGFTEVLRRAGVREASDAERYLEIIHSSGRHLLNLINDILDLSKVEAGRLEAESLPTAPHEVARDVVATLAERATSKGLALTLAADGPVPARIEADPARLRQILTNLIGNAIKFTEHGGVTVRLRLEGSGALRTYAIDVADSGIGIAAEQLDAVFEPFVQAESSTTRRFGGTGLGLTISRGFARAMGGDIDVTSRAGEGTTFTLRLPAVVPHEAKWLSEVELQSLGDAPAPQPAVVRYAFEPRRVLVVDDGVENRQLVRVLLEEVGLEVHEAEHGQAAIDQLKAAPFDLVLMDMQMPVMDGPTAVRALRAMGMELPILALTANAMKGYEREITESGFSGHLTKPIDVDALLSALAERLGGRRLADNEVREAREAAPPVPLPCASDEASLVSRLAEHPKLRRVVARFIDQLPERLTAMRSAAEQADAAALEALAHWLKGAGGSVGFDDLTEPARQLESHAHAAEFPACITALDTLDRLASRIARGHTLQRPTEMQP